MTNCRRSISPESRITTYRSTDRTVFFATFGSAAIRPGGGFIIFKKFAFRRCRYAANPLKTAFLVYLRHIRYGAPGNLLLQMRHTNYARACRIPSGAGLTQVPLFPVIRRIRTAVRSRQRDKGALKMSAELDFLSRAVATGRLSRRDFLGRAAALGVSAALANTMLSGAAQAQTLHQQPRPGPVSDAGAAEFRLHMG
jgi:hypothetical protein